MIVMKFGGTSVGDARSIRAAVGIVRSRLERRPVVVVSAMAGVTDALIAAWERASRGRGAGGSIAARHLAAARDLGLPLQDVRGEARGMEAALAAVRGRRGSSAADRDRIVSFGERLSAHLVAGALHSAGVEAAAAPAGDAGLVTDAAFGEAEPLPEAYPALRRGLRRRPGVPVVTGFIGRTRDGRPTTLGRGGSDYTAAILAAALGAEEVEIWTDVSGVMSADPRVAPEARTIERLSFAEAAELAYFGAKVLHPKTLLPAMAAEIPVRVLNTGDPAHPGTLITRAATRSRGVVKAIASKKHIIVVDVVSTRMLLAHGFLARLFQVVADRGVVVDLVSTSEVSVSMTVDRGDRLREAVREIRRFAQVRINRDRAVVCVVGEGLGQVPGLAGKVFSTLGREGINVEMISQGASKLNISFVVRGDQADGAVRALHRRFFRARAGGLFGAGRLTAPRTPAEPRDRAARDVCAGAPR